MADREKLIELLANYFDIGDSYAYNLTRVKSAFACGTMGFDDFEEFDEETVEDIATHLIAHGVTVRERGRWHLEAHEEHSNYRWNVTAECPYCHSEKKEIWAGFFPGFPKDLAESVSLESAKTVKLSNFCPNCGAKMDGDGNG